MKESTKAQEAYEHYLAMGSERSLAKLTELLGRPPGYLQQLKDWSVAHKWQERCRAYDADQLKALRQKLVSAVDTMNDRHVQIALQGQRKALKRIEELMEAKELPAAAAIQLLKLSIDLERLARGAATEQLALTGAENGPIDMVIRTVWGRGADPRRREADDSEESERQ